MMDWGTIFLILFWLMLLIILLLFIVCKTLVDFYDGPDKAITVLSRVGLWEAFRQTRYPRRKNTSRNVSTKS